MNEEQMNELRKDIIAIGRLLWEKDLVSGLNGNISVRVDDQRILLTGHGTCLGLLQEKDVLLATVDGKVLESGSLSTEKLLHTEIYKNFLQVKAVVHTHTVYTNAYFLENQKLTPRIFESKFYLGEVAGIEQFTPSVTDAVPVIDALKKNNVVVLRQHGVVAMGQDLFDCFLLIQALEEAVKVDAISRLYRGASAMENKKTIEMTPSGNNKKYKLFSQEQIDEIVKLVNADAKLGEMGSKTNMTMDLAVQLNETKRTYSFRFESGRITNVGQDENAEFLISAPENVWRAVFNREIDPFVATTQKKMNLRGDFARISKWYAPCSRVFELWQQVPVE
jgi:L-fuculose-phosphate aldolase